MLGKTAGKYRIIDRIGRGSMGTVYRASDETLRRDVAIKVLNADFNDPAAGRRFRAEAIAIARLNHPGIAKIYDLFEHEGQWLMAIELVPGQTLENMVKEGGPLSADDAAELAWQALAGLAHAHGMGVVHRDLKPANLMVADGRLKIMDFGIARVAGTEHLTSAGLLMGTPAYMAPEQVLGQEIDARTDVFAMGCVLFFLATARLPFKGETAMQLVQSRLNDSATPVRTLRHELPEWFAAVVARALAREPANRFQTADDFRLAIERGRAGLPVDLAPPSTTPSHLMETVLPGSMPIPGELATTTSGALLAPDARTRQATIPAPAALTSAAQLRTRQTPRVPLWLGATAAIVILAGTALWLGPWRQTPAAPAVPGQQETPATPPTGQVEPPSLTPLPAPAPTTSPTTSPTASVTSTPPAPGAPPGGAASTSPATASGTPTPTAAGAAALAGRRGGVADTLASFATVKLLKITGRKGEDVDAVLRLGGGLISVSPRRAGDSSPVTLTYKELLAVTFVRDRDPRWVPTLAAPPAGLDLPAGMFGLGRRPARPWLVIQGQARYVVLTLSDADAEQILKALGDRSRVKIDRPGK